MATIPLQLLPGSPTYSAANVQDYVTWMPTMILHYFNDSDVDLTLIVSSANPDFYGSYHCAIVPLPADDEVLIGPFNVIYSPLISISCASITNVTVAALYTDYTYQIEAVESTELSGVFIASPTVLAGVLSSAATTVNGE